MKDIYACFLREKNWIMILKKLAVILFVLFFVYCSNAQSRRVINIPNIEGYTTLKCDFHMHTVFSDGTVWPTVRVEEAWKEGLDAIAITDHVEYRPHTVDINADHNRSFEIAEPLSKQLGIILVHGTEITRSMPPGHLNALFISNANLLELDDVNDALKEARDQGAFIMWNHPCWKVQQPDSTVWWDEHSYLFDNDLLHGIEVYNWGLCPEALAWAKSKNLTMIGSTDVHDPLDVNDGHRPMTLVFAKSRTQGGIREAMFSHRTAVYYDNMIVGKSSLIEPLFFASLKIQKDLLKLSEGTNGVVRIKNDSDVDYELELVQPGVGFDAPENITLKAHQITLLTLSGNSTEVSNAAEINVYYRVLNMLTDVNENLLVTFTFKNK